jgi:hypothetical protein
MLPTITLSPSEARKFKRFAKEFAYAKFKISIDL